MLEIDGIIVRMSRTSTTCKLNIGPVHQYDGLASITIVKLPAIVFCVFTLEQFHPVRNLAPLLNPWT